MRNPTRRNRNIGTAKSGYKHRVPYGSAFYLEVFNYKDAPEKVTLDVHGSPTTVYIDKTSNGLKHCCTPDDLAKVLIQLPANDIAGLENFYLHQSTQRTTMLSPAWARLNYFAGPHYTPLITIDAQPDPLKLSWPLGLRVYQQKELEFLRTVCCEYKLTNRSHELVFDSTAIRKIQLERSLPHEVSHWVDFRNDKDHLTSEQKERRANEYAARCKIVLWPELL